MMRDNERIPVTVLIMTKDEEKNLGRCLDSLQDFYQIIVVDSYSRDRTADIARGKGALLVPFSWNGRYPKKRQWSLHHVPIATEWVLFVDADEVMTDALKDEISKVVIPGLTGDPEGHFPDARSPLRQGFAGQAGAGMTEVSAYFIYGQPVYAAKMMRHGRWNNKIVLFRKGMLSFPDVEDEEEINMGEIEGHYQPVVNGKIGQLSSPLIHHGPDDKTAWDEKHARYARWMAWMIKNGHEKFLYGTEQGARYWIKRIFLKMPLMPLVAFCDSYLIKRGFLDGHAGLGYALSRARYYRMIGKELRK